MNADYDDYVDYDGQFDFDIDKLIADTPIYTMPDYPDIRSDDDDFIGPPTRVGGAPVESPNSQPSWLDKAWDSLKDSVPDVLKGLLDKGVGFAKGSPLAAGGIGGAALMALLSSMNSGQQQAPQYIGLGASGPAPAAPQPKFVAMPSQAQSYKSMLGMKDGGVVHMNSGDFVFSKKAMDNVGGIGGLRKRGYPAKKIVGPGTGTSDSIPATIDGRPVARVANGEALIPGGARMKGLAGLHSRMRKGK